LYLQNFRYRKFLPKFSFISLIYLYLIGSFLLSFSIAHRINLGLCNYGAAISLFTATLHASSRVFHRLFNNIMHCPSEFFDITPKGRILDRCSNDINCLDLVMPINIRMVMSTAFQVISSSRECFIFLIILVPRSLFIS